MEQLYQDLVDSLCERAFQKFLNSPQAQTLQENLECAEESFPQIKDSPEATRWLDAAISYSAQRESFVYCQGLHDGVALLRLLGALG